MVRGLVEYLQKRREALVRTVKVHYGDSDPTYGVPTIAKFEVIDFDALLQAIDEFCAEFKEPKDHA